MSNENMTTVTENNYEPKGLAKILNKFFHFKERGGTMKGEIVAGISVFLVSVAILLMNTRIVAGTIGADNAGYCGIYLAATIIAFLGTLAIGFVANLPLVQISSLGLSTAFISLVGAGNGLTYQNLLAISFIAAILYTVLVSVPVVKKYVTEALPKPVRKALPVGMGLFIIFYAIKEMGIINVSEGTFPFVGVSGAGNGNLMYVVGALAAVLAIVAAFVFIKIKKHVSTPVFYATLVGFMAFYLVALVKCFSLVFSVDRAYIAIGAENMYTISAGFAGLDFGSVFTKGFDFSAYTGNVGQLWVYGILTFMFMGMYESEASVGAVALYNDSVDMNNTGRALLVNAATNVIAPIFGALPVTVGKSSVAASVDNGKSGLVSVVASIGFLLAMFTWVFFAFMATYTQVVTDYGHSTSNSFAEYTQAVFAVTDGIMLVLGVLMLKGLDGIDFKNIDELLPFAATVIGIAFMQNIVYGVAFGVIAYVLVKVCSFNKETIKSIGIPTAVLTAIMIVVLCLI